MTVMQMQDQIRPADARLRLRVLRSRAEIDGIAAQWRALERCCRDEFIYFQTHAWCVAWLEHVGSRMGAGVVGPRIVTVWDGEDLVALLPLMERRCPGGVRVLDCLGEPHTQYGGLVADPRRLGAEGARLIADYIAAPDACDGVFINSVPEGSALDRVLGQRWQARADDNASSYLDLAAFGDAQAFRNTFSGRRRKSRRQRLRRLEKIGAVSLRAVWPDDAEFADVVDRVIAFKQRWLIENGRLSRGLAVAGLAEFLAALPGRRKSCEGAVALVLEAGGQLVAAEVSMIHRGRLHSYLGGFDGDLRHASPGKVQMEMAICWAIKNGLCAYDLLGNRADYKATWSDREVVLKSYAHVVTTRGWLYARLWLDALRPALKRCYGALPAGMRKRAGRRQLGCQGGG